MAVSQKSLDNLKKGRKFTKENAAEFGRRGQWKMMEAKLWANARHELFSIITHGDPAVTDEEMLETLRKHGIDEEELKTFVRLMCRIGKALSVYLNTRPSP